jgi:hypothetical protein
MFFWHSFPKCTVLFNLKIITMATANTETTHLKDTADLIEKHVKEESTTGVSTSINSWIKKLSEHKELKGIADDLEELKAALSEKDGKKITDLMSKLGTATTKAAESAEGQEATQIKAVGKALSAAAKMTSKMAK